MIPTWWYRKERARAVTTKQRCCLLIPNTVLVLVLVLVSQLEPSIFTWQGIAERCDSSDSDLITPREGSSPKQLLCSLSETEGKCRDETTSITLNSSNVLIGDLACQNHWDTVTIKDSRNKVGVSTFTFLYSW